MLPRLKQNLKHFYSGNISIDFMLNIFIFLSILKFTILHVYVTQARHFFLFFSFSYHNVKRIGDRNALNKHLYYYFYYYYYY